MSRVQVGGITKGRHRSATVEGRGGKNYTRNLYRPVSSAQVVYGLVEVP